MLVAWYTDSPLNAVERTHTVTRSTSSTEVVPCSAFCQPSSRNEAMPVVADTSSRAEKFTHNCKGGQYSSAKVHRAVNVTADGIVTVDESEISNLEYEILEGR